MAFTKTCKYCGLGGLEWTKTPEGFRLRDPKTGKLHLGCMKGGYTPEAKAVASALPPPSTYKPVLPDALPPPSKFSVKLDLDSIAEKLDEIELPEPPADAGPSILAQLLEGVV